MIIRQPETRTVEDYGSLINALVKQIDELYSSPETRKYCRKLAREFHEQTANFIQKVVDDPKFNLSNCPWPFGLIILEERKGKKPGETECTQLYGYDRTTRRWRTPDDTAAVHTFLALYHDCHLRGDLIVTYEIRDICPYVGISPLIMSDTAEMVQKEIPALLRCAREDLKAKGFLKQVDGDGTSNTHSKDFRSVTWHGKTYSFNKNQAIVIKLLWKAMEKGEGIHQHTIGESLDTVSKKYRLLDTFRQHGKVDPAWSEMIYHLGKGVYTLK